MNNGYSQGSVLLDGSFAFIWDTNMRDWTPDPHYRGSSRAYYEPKSEYAYDKNGNQRLISGWERDFNKNI
jgi:hypothetical protein